MKKMNFGTIRINRGTIYLNLKNCAIPSLVLATSGIGVTKIKGSKGLFVNINDIIEWHEKELKYNKTKYTEGERKKYIKTLENNLTELYIVVKEIDDEKNEN